MGDFKNAGQAWCREPESVLVHDFPQDAVGQAISYGIYTLNDNQGHVCVGDCFDTPRFTVQAITNWWWSEGSKRFPDAHQMLILAEAGGSNSCRSRVWKAQLQEQLCDEYRIPVTVCHYPTGCSKWNPVEHRLFSHISMNWAGKPLRSFNLMCRYIRGTTTATGLTVTVDLQRGGNELGEHVSDKEMAQLRLRHHSVCPQWNYTLRPCPLREIQARGQSEYGE